MVSGDNQKCSIIASCPSVPKGVYSLQAHSCHNSIVNHPQTQLFPPKQWFIKRYLNFTDPILDIANSFYMLPTFYFFLKLNSVSECFLSSFFSPLPYSQQRTLVVVHCRIQPSLSDRRPDLMVRAIYKFQYFQRIDLSNLTYILKVGQCIRRRPFPTRSLTTSPVRWTKRFENYRLFWKSKKQPVAWFYTWRNAQWQIKFEKQFE